MSRLEPIRPEDMDATQRELYDEIAQGPRAQGPQHFALTHQDGSLSGPFNALLLSPGLGRALQGVGAALRYRSGLSTRTRELAILAVAGHWDCAFEQMAHERIGAAAGLSTAEMEAVAAGRVPSLADDHERACAVLVQEMVAGDVGEETWAACRGSVASATVLELTTLVGYYATLALQLRVFRVG